VRAARARTARLVRAYFLTGASRPQFVLSTKVGHYGNGVFDFSAARVTESVAESLERLCVEYIDVIQCHDIEFADVRQIVQETLPGAHASRVC
jgi:L-galactose dehydrogenase